MSNLVISTASIHETDQAQVRDKSISFENFERLFVKDSYLSSLIFVLSVREKIIYMVLLQLLYYLKVNAQTR